MLKVIIYYIIYFIIINSSIFYSLNIQPQEQNTEIALVESLKNENKKLKAEITILKKQNETFKENLQQYKMDLNLAHDSLSYLLVERSNINKEFISELNNYYDTLDEKQKLVMDHFIPSRTKYDIYNLKVGDKYNDFIVEKFDVYYNSYGEIVEYNVIFIGETTITGQLYYNRLFDGDVWLKIDKSNLSKLPHSYSYEYISIINSDKLKNDLQDSYYEGVEVKITINGYEVVEEDYTYGHTGIFYKSLKD